MEGGLLFKGKGIKIAKIKAIEKIHRGKRMKGRKREAKRFLPVMKHLRINNEGIFLFIYLNLGGKQ